MGFENSRDPKRKQTLIHTCKQEKDHFDQDLWQIKVTPDNENGLTNTCAVDVLPLRGVDKQRFVQKPGSISPGIMNAIVAAQLPKLLNFREITFI